VFRLSALEQHQLKAVTRDMILRDLAPARYSTVTRVWSPTASKRTSKPAVGSARLRDFAKRLRGKPDRDQCVALRFSSSALACPGLILCERRPARLVATAAEDHLKGSS
jgi:hypothetical protein